MQNSGSGYSGLKSIAKKPFGGFYFLHARSLLAAWIMFKRGRIELYDLRLWLACHEMIERRCTLEPDRLPTFQEKELILLVGSGTITKAKKGIKKLTDLGLLQWEQNCITLDTHQAESTLEDGDDWLDTLVLVKNNRRKIPMPRKMLRHLIKTRHVNLIGTVFGYLFRCLYYRKNRCVSGGRCKTSWIVEALQLDERNVKHAKKMLVELGWLIPCSADQRSLNRWGQPVIINLSWRAKENSTNAKTPPLNAQNRAKLPPPIYNKKPLTGSNNQYHKKSSGVKNKTVSQKPPTQKHITMEDLRDPVRLDQLYWEIIKSEIMPHTEFNRLLFFSAAERALAEGKQNPCGLFVRLYTKKLWHFVTQAQEDEARVKIKKLDFGEETRLPGQDCGSLPVYDSLAA